MRLLKWYFHIFIGGRELINYSEKVQIKGLPSMTFLLRHSKKLNLPIESPSSFFAFFSQKRHKRNSFPKNFLRFHRRERKIYESSIDGKLRRRKNFGFFRVEINFPIIKALSKQQSETDKLPINVSKLVFFWGLFYLCVGERKFSGRHDWENWEIGQEFISCMMNFLWFIAQF